MPRGQAFREAHIPLPAAECRKVLTGRGNRAWAGWMVLGTLVSAGYPLVASDVAQAVLSCVVGVSAVLVTIAGVRRNRPADPRAWQIFIGGQILWVLGDM